MIQPDKQMLTKLVGSQQPNKQTNDYSSNTATLPHEMNGRQLQLPVAEWINIKFMEAYQSKWGNQELPSTWKQGISILTINEIRHAIAKVMTCPVTVKQLNGWPPSLPQFISYAKGEIDYDGAFTRCLAKKPEGRIEKYVYQQCSYNVRVSTDTEARRIHKREMNLAVELDRKGELELQEETVKALPVNSVKNENDLARERYEASGNRNPIQDRIDAIRKAKK